MLVITTRASGILLHPTSLPGPFGIGDLGSEAYNFANLLADTGQSFWQILPLGPSGYGNSPYMCFSAFAGNPLLISLNELAREGLLDAIDIENRPDFNETRVDFQAVASFKIPLLVKSFQLFKRKFPHALPSNYYLFLEQNKFWLEDFALFMALKDNNNYRSWINWDEDLAQCQPRSLKECKDRLGGDIEFQKYLQYIFFKQWDALKRHCGKIGVKIIGDMPLYIAYDSVDVWINRHLFYLDEKGNPTVVGGVPPDYFNATGQRWGNPIYRWDVMKQSGYQWWVDRFKLNFKLFDILRLDHFRGYEAYWEILASEPTAVAGRWVKGPGGALFNAVESKLGKIPVIAEDLGVITPEVEDLRDELGFPGMRILQMAFGTDPKAKDYQPHNYIRQCVVYSSTHDHNTTHGWFTAKPGTATTQSFEEVEQERKNTLEYLGTDGKEINWDFIRLAMSSVADLAIFPIQDVLGLGSSSRMNLPGTSGGNWEWRMTADALSPENTDRLKQMTRIYERGFRKS